ncbi:MAG: hypothetical protein LBK66_08425 [Spirochaetaceae bacterium]|nr:hypothetical protein [Spirochaetaceae bacterium]
MANGWRARMQALFADLKARSEGRFGYVSAERMKTRWRVDKEGRGGVG